MVRRLEWPRVVSSLKCQFYPPDFDVGRSLQVMTCQAAGSYFQPWTELGGIRLGLWPSAPVLMLRE
jgi:hypothetical protein